MVPNRPTEQDVESKASTQEPVENTPEAITKEVVEDTSKPIAKETVEEKTRFQDLGLEASLLKGINDLGFEYCTPIQSKILPNTLKRRDALGKAQTGTGKTAAFLITVIDDLLKNPLSSERYIGEPRAVIIAPTRELVIQIGDDAQNLCKHTPIRTVTLIGGADMEKQRRQIEKQPVDIIVATPGRLLDFMKRREIDLLEVDVLVLDEADRMLDMGFIPQVKRIVSATPDKQYRQTLLFSATFNYEVIELSSRWTQDPIHVEIEPENVASDNVEQKVYLVTEDEKFKILRAILKQGDVEKAIIFANRRDQTQRLYDGLKKLNISVGILSGEIAQNKRSKTLNEFKEGKIDILVATDVAGRGIHVDNVTHVINYFLPENPDDYVHRIGRTGRAGTKGVSISLACEEGAFQIPEIEKQLGIKLDCELPPEELVS